MKKLIIAGISPISTYFKILQVGIYAWCRYASPRMKPTHVSMTLRHPQHNIQFFLGNLLFI